MVTYSNTAFDISTLYAVHYTQRNRPALRPQHHELHLHLHIPQSGLQIATPAAAMKTNG